MFDVGPLNRDGTPCEGKGIAGELIDMSTTDALGGVVPQSWQKSC